VGNQWRSSIRCCASERGRRKRPGPARSGGAWHPDRACEAGKGNGVEACDGEARGRAVVLGEVDGGTNEVGVRIKATGREDLGEKANG
jgi:hypothetical protein